MPQFRPPPRRPSTSLLRNLLLLSLAACAGNEPGPSAGPGRLVFARAGNGLLDIYAVDASGQALRQLTTHLAADDWPAWSPDTLKVLFHSDRVASAADTTVVFEIYSMNADGTGVTALTTVDTADSFHPTWSHDGTQIAFASNRDGNSEIYVMDANGANQVRRTTNSGADAQPAWSPDGSKIAFVTDRDGNAEIYVMNAADGTGLVNLTNDAASDFAPAWSPDGTQIAFQSSRVTEAAVWVMNADGSNPVRLTNPATPAGAPSWSPDGTRIAYETDGDLWVMNADGSRKIRITSGFTADGLPRWRPIL